jgi:hypothetical protein
LDPKNEGVPLHFWGPKPDFCSENEGKIRDFDPKLSKNTPKFDKKCPKNPSDGVKKGEKTPILSTKMGVFPL